MAPLQQSSRAVDISTSTSSSRTTITIINNNDDEVAHYGMAQVGLSPNLPLRGVDMYTDNTRSFTPFQHFARAAPLLTMGAYALNPEVFDAATQSVWSWIDSWDITHTGLFEAHVASFSFVFFIAAFSVTHLVLGNDETKMAKYRLDGQAPQENPLRWATLEGFSEWFNPLVSYLVSIWIYQQVFQTYHEPPPLAPTFGVLVVEVLFGVFLYDLLFAPVHVLLHKGPLKDLRQAHGYHHRHTNGALNPVETVQHSYLDGGLQVMVNILVQHISPFGGPKHILSRLIHNVIVTYLLTESHSGYNFSWMSHNIWPEFLGGAPRHERHHKDGRVYYQQFFTYLDDAMGWTDQDVQQDLVQKQAQRQNQQQQQQQQQLRASLEEENEFESSSARSAASDRIVDVATATAHKSQTTSDILA